MKKLFICIALCSFLFLPLAAREETHENHSSDHSNKKVAYTTTINAIVTWPPQALVGVTQSFKVPLMQFDNPINFSKAVYSFTLGGTFQFDLGAVIPHDWSHVIFKTDQYALYKAMSGVNSETSWLYQADSGANRNGWRYMSSYVIGYKMPLFLDLIAMKIDVEKKLFASPKGLDNKVWGEDLFLTTFGPIINFNIKKDYNIMLLAQWYTYPVYKNEVEGSFYQTKIIDTAKKTQVKFYQVGIVFYMNINR